MNIDTKLNRIILDYGVRVLDVVNGKENPTLGELVDKPTKEIKQLLQELIDEVIGEDVDKTEPPYTLHDYGFMSANAVNNRVKEQRQRAKELLEELCNTN